MTHGIGALLSIAAIPILVVIAVRAGGGVKLAAALVYTITMLVEYLMSTLYHAIAVDRAQACVQGARPQRDLPVHRGNVYTVLPGHAWEVTGGFTWLRSCGS